MTTLSDLFAFEVIGTIAVAGPIALMYFIGNAIDSSADLSDKFGLGFSFLLVLTMALTLFFFVGRAILT